MEKPKWKNPMQSKYLSPFIPTAWERPGFFGYYTRLELKWSTSNNLNYPGHSQYNCSKEILRLLSFSFEFALCDRLYACIYGSSLTLMPFSRQLGKNFERLQGLTSVKVYEIRERLNLFYCSALTASIWFVRSLLSSHA